MTFERPQFHFKTRAGWINDPNGLVWFNGEYHAFYQHLPHQETPWGAPMHWGHARTKDFLHWEELPVALAPDRPYDAAGCWSGTAIVKDGVLYLFYASIHNPQDGGRRVESVSVATSKDGLHFEKYEGNPVIPAFPADGCPDFRDPAVLERDGRYYLVMASGNAEAHAARLLLYESADLLHWAYAGILCEWENSLCAECPSFLHYGDRYMLTASVMRTEKERFFACMVGSFDGRHFTVEQSASLDRGPDQYAGQAFTDGSGRNILIAWIPGWDWAGFAEKDLGCFSLPRELALRDGKLVARPLPEVAHLLQSSDPAVRRTPDGFVIERPTRPPVVHTGEVRELQMLRDGYVLEVFVNGGEQVYTALLL